jgi:hypothetical protein
LGNDLQKAGLIIGLFLFLHSLSAQAVMTRPVTVEGAPTEIHVVGVILDVDRIDSCDQSFTLFLDLAVFYSLDRSGCYLASVQQGSEYAGKQD